MVQPIVSPCLTSVHACACHTVLSCLPRFVMLALPIGPELSPGYKVWQKWRLGFAQVNCTNFHRLVYLWVPKSTRDLWVMATEESVDKLLSLLPPRSVVISALNMWAISTCWAEGWATSASLGLPTSLGGKWPQAKMTSWEIKLAQKQLRFLEYVICL